MFTEKSIKHWQNTFFDVLKNTKQTIVKPHYCIDAKKDTSSYEFIFTFQ